MSEDPVVVRDDCMDGVACWENVMAAVLFVPCACWNGLGVGAAGGVDAVWW